MVVDDVYYRCATSVSNGSFGSFAPLGSATSNRTRVSDVLGGCRRLLQLDTLTSYPDLTKLSKGTIGYTSN